MRWNYNQTDLDARDAHRISESMRHERLFEQGLKISLLESTPLHEPTPRPSMVQYREDQLQKQAKSVMDVMGTEEDDLNY